MSSSQSPPPRRSLTLLTDFGTTDYYVAAVKGVLLQHAPDATLVDLTHDVPPGDLPVASWLLAAASRWYPAGSVHLAVVDPGVGSSRRILAARAAGAFYVAPDNGLLTHVLAAAAAAAAGDPADTEPSALHAVDRDDLFLPGPGATFHGRDRFAPVAAFLAAGGDLADLGPAVDDPVLLPRTEPTAEGTPPRQGLPGSVLRGRVVHVDRYGNLVTDVPSEWLGDEPLSVEVAGDRGGGTGHRASHFADIPAGAAAALPGSLGTLEVAMDGDSVAEAWGAGRGDGVTVRFGRGAPSETSPEPPSREPARRARNQHEETSTDPESNQGGSGMTQWEYRVINIRSENYRLDPDCDEELNDLGADGWEMVGLTSVNFKSGATDNIAMVFKRPLDDYDDYD